MIFFLDSGAPSHGSSFWPPPLPGTGPAPHHPGLSPYPPNPLLSPHHHAAAAHAHAASLQQQQHSIYLQHQQYQQQLQQQHQRRSGASQPQPHSQGQPKPCIRGSNGEPETITLSDDDDGQTSLCSRQETGDGSTAHEKAKPSQNKTQSSCPEERDALPTPDTKEPNELVSNRENTSHIGAKNEKMEIERSSADIDSRSGSGVKSDKTGEASLNGTNSPLKDIEIVTTMVPY